MSTLQSSKKIKETHGNTIVFDKKQLQLCIAFPSGHQCLCGVAVLFMVDKMQKSQAFDQLGGNPVARCFIIEATGPPHQMDDLDSS